MLSKPEFSLHPGPRQHSGLFNSLILICALSLLLSATSASAQVAYVIDALWLGVKQSRDDGAITVKIIHSGEQLNLIKIIDGQAQIKSSDGTLGWVDASYLTRLAPISTELDQAKKIIKVNLATVSRLETQVRRLQELSQPFDPERRKMKQSLLLLSCCAIIGSIGFWAGVRWHRQRVQRRLGGLLP